MHRSMAVLSGLLAVLLISAPALAANSSCQPVFDAITKIVTTPSHSYSTQTAAFANGQTRTTETIYVQGKIYMLVKGKWMVSPVTPSEVLEQEEENRKNAKPVCQFVRNEAVNNELASVYSLSRETETGKEAGQIWISRSTGLALRKEVDLDTGGAMGKSHLSARFEYSNVKPPM